jgi:hypothetical protein
MAGAPRPVSSSASQVPPLRSAAMPVAAIAGPIQATRVKASEKNV